MRRSNAEMPWQILRELRHPGVLELLGYTLARPSPTSQLIGTMAPCRQSFLVYEFAATDLYRAMRSRLCSQFVPTDSDASFVRRFAWQQRLQVLTDCAAASVMLDFTASLGTCVSCPGGWPCLLAQLGPAGTGILYHFPMCDMCEVFHCAGPSRISGKCDASAPRISSRRTV